MRTHSRVRRLALTALCAGGTIGAAGLAVVPGQALAATTACSNVYGSGSTLQTPVQEFPVAGSGPGAKTFTQLAGPDGAFKNCSKAPAVGYNTTTSLTTEDLPSTGTGSGTGEKEFALDSTAGSVTPADSSNGSWLDGFIGTDAPPSSAQLTNAQNSAGSDPETVPVIQAPVAVVVNLPSGCTVAKSPILTNVDLSKAFDDNISWTTLLTDAGAKPSDCGTADPTVEVRYDSSGTSFAFKQYLSQIDSSLWSPWVETQGQGTANSWPAAVSDTYVSGGQTLDNSGSGGEANAVYDTPGSIGYVNTADAAAVGFGQYAAGATQFWSKVQNNGVGTKSIVGAEPALSTDKGNCYATYKGTLPSGNEPDWSSVFVANPKMASSTVYSICTLTYDVAWSSYSGSSTLNSLYTNQYTGETPSGVAATTKDYLTWLLGTATKQGQTVVPLYYTKLPANIQKVAATTVKSYVGLN